MSHASIASIPLASPNTRCIRVPLPAAEELGDGRLSRYVALTRLARGLRVSAVRAATEVSA